MNAMQGDLFSEGMSSALNMLKVVDSLILMMRAVLLTEICKVTLEYILAHKLVKMQKNRCLLTHFLRLSMTQTKNMVGLLSGRMTKLASLSNTDLDILIPDEF
jgi:uncharacterized membrane protein